MTRYLNQLHENTAPVSGDYLLSYDASATAGDEDRWVNVSKFGVLANAQTWAGVQTFTYGPVVPGTINDEKFALDSSASTFTLTAGQSLPFSASGAFSGLIQLIEPATGAGAVYFVSGGTVNLISTIGGVWTANTTTGSNQFDVSYVSSKYQLKNKYAVSKTFTIMALRARNAP